MGLIYRPVCLTAECMDGVKCIHLGMKIGEFPRIIFAPGTPEQAFYLTNKAFEMTEKYQVPAIIMTDQYLADSQWTFSKFDYNLINITPCGLCRSSIRVRCESACCPRRVQAFGGY